MSKQTSFNGHRNWAHWNVSLWFGNDEALYGNARRLIRRCDTREQAAALMLQKLHEQGVYTTPDGAIYSKSAIYSAMCDL